MKTQVDTFRKKQEQNNRIMMIAIVICGVLLFVATGFVGSGNDNCATSSKTNYQPLNNIEAALTTINNSVLEVDKLRQVIVDRQENIYRTVLSDLTSIEEPGMTFQDIASVNAFQQAYFNDNNDESYTMKSNAYLNKLYKEKNEEVYVEIENESRFRELLATENENELNFEVWMTEDNVWNCIKETDNNFNEFLEAVYEAKNKEVFAAIEEEAYWREILAPEPEFDHETAEFDPHPEVEIIRIETDKNTSPSASETGITPNYYLLGLLAEKNEAVFKAIELQCKCREFLAAVEEEPLEVEDWMVDERCWCPNKKQEEHLYAEPYAMKTK